MAIVDEGDGIISFHGKKYSTVKRRVDAFRADCPIHRGWAIHTTAVETEKLVTFRGRDSGTRRKGRGYGPQA